METKPALWTRPSSRRWRGHEFWPRDRSWYRPLPAWLWEMKCAWGDRNEENLPSNPWDATGRVSWLVVDWAAHPAERDELRRRFGTGGCPQREQGGAPGHRTSHRTQPSPRLQVRLE